MTNLIYCYSFNCIHNNEGHCMNKKIRLGTQGICMDKNIDKHDN